MSVGEASPRTRRSPAPRRAAPVPPLAFAFVALGCGEATPVVFAAPGEWTTPAAVRLRQGMELARDEVNGGGGIGGRPLVLDFIDVPPNDPQAAAALARRIVERRDVAAVVGYTGSSTAGGAVPLYEGHLPAVLPLTNSAAWRSVPTWTFRLTLTPESYARTVASFADSMGWSRVVVLFDNTPHARASADALRGELGGAALFHPLYTVEAVGSFHPIVEAVVRRDVDAVVLVVGERNAGELAPLFHAEDPGLPLLGDHWADLPSDTLLRGSYRLEAEMSGPDGSLNDQAFVSRFRAHFGHDPDTYAAYGHDAVMIAAWAAVEEGPSRASIRQGLARLDGVRRYQGATGPLAFDSTGARRDQELSVWEVCLDDSIRRPGLCR